MGHPVSHPFPDDLGQHRRGTCAPIRLADHPRLQCCRHVRFRVCARPGLVSFYRRTPQNYSACRSTRVSAACQPGNQMQRCDKSQPYADALSAHHPMRNAGSTLSADKEHSISYYACTDVLSSAAAVEGSSANGSAGRLSSAAMPPERQRAPAWQPCFPCPWDYRSGQA
jgi:hypothetical protein